MTYPWAIVIVAGLAFTAYLIKLGSVVLDDYLARREATKRELARRSVELASSRAFADSPLGRAMGPQMQELTKVMSALSGRKIQ